MLPKSNKIFVKPDKQHSNTYDTCSVTFGLRYRARLAKCMSTLRSGDTVTNDRIERCCYC